MLKLCFVCLGNICRSPVAEGVMRELVFEAGLDSQVAVASAGTARYHQGEPADPRALAAAAQRGVQLTGRARQIQPQDYKDFDYILAMDPSNLEHLVARAPGETRHKVRLLRSFEPGAGAEAAVKDPYYGEAADFEEVVEVCFAACRGLLAFLKAEHRLYGRE